MKEINKSVKFWLLSLISMIFMMVIVGGVTRLTGSGLSMIEWRPIYGILPPMSDLEWTRVFDLYRESPEYKKVNYGMSLSDFKFIFFWEYLHRVLGRFFGLLYFLPLVFFWLKGSLNSRLKKFLLLGFFLSLCQAVLGWYMVKSGLVDRPSVSQYRLASHLGLAFVIGAVISWAAFEAVFGLKPFVNTGRAFKLTLAYTIIIFSQILYGALTAGLKAGHFFNTFPLMGNSFVPDSLFQLKPIYINFFENPIMVQFVHRLLGILIFFFSFYLVISLRKEMREKFHRRALNLLVGLVFVQFALGIYTLLSYVQIEFAALHQATAYILFLVALLNVYFGSSIELKKVNES